MNHIMLEMPKVVIDTHCHGRGMKESCKTTPKKVLGEAKSAGIGITCFMPNTIPPITNMRVLKLYNSNLDEARAELGIPHAQYIWFGAINSNIQACREALCHPAVIGIKVYPKKHQGESVTVGRYIGVSWISTIARLLELSADTGKPIAFHCEDPVGNHRPEDEWQYIDFILNQVRYIKHWYGNPKIVICHASTKRSVQLVERSWQEGLEVALEFSPHHLWFGNSKSAYGNPDLGLDEEFYTCYPPLRNLHDQVFLQYFIWKSHPLVFIGSDSASHQREAKLEGAAGIPSNQEMIAVIASLSQLPGVQASQTRIAELLSWNAAEFLGIQVPRETISTQFEMRNDHCVYNNGIVVNPWQEERLLFPTLS